MAEQGFFKKPRQSDNQTSHNLDICIFNINALNLRCNVDKQVELTELAAIVQKRPGTVAVFFSRHRLSIHSSKDLQFYFDYLKSGKRMESGKRKAAHLKKYQFRPNESRLQKARSLVKNRRLTWHVADVNELSEDSIVEHVLTNGDWTDFLELLRLLGKKRVIKIFSRQVEKDRINYRPQTVNFFRHYLGLTHEKIRK